MNNFDYFNLVEKLMNSLSNTKIYEITISLEDVYFGKEISLKIPIKKLCPICKGKGFIISEIDCNYCNGSGKIKTYYHNENLTFFSVEKCPNCLGFGKELFECICDNGIVEENEIISLNLPPGTEQNELILLRKNDELNETIYLKIKIEDEIYRIEGLNLLLNLNIPKEYVDENKTIIIKHPLKKLKLKAKELVENEKTTIYGLGLINKKNERGNLIINTTII
ncbi:MAG: DnaJ C-terminal domain-containing protein [Candidatus Woesearchaeota archaeon]